MGSREVQGLGGASRRSNAVAAFIGFFLAAVIWRSVTHVAGWQDHSFVDSLVTALVMGCVGAVLSLVLGRTRNG